MKKRKYKYLIFDLDGTVTDSAEGVQRCFNYGLSKLGKEVSDHTRLNVIGPPLKESYMGQFGMSEADAEKALGYYRELYRKKGMLKWNKLYIGIDSLLKDLYEAGYTILLGSSKPTEFCVKILEYFNVAKYFTRMDAASLDSSRSTKEAVLENSIKMANITDKSEAVLIGDTKFDLMGAEYVGIDAVAVEYGYGTYEELREYKTVYIAKTVDDLRNYFL